MANTYTWDCKTVNAYIEKDGNSDVIYCIHYRLTAASDQKDKNDNFYSATSIGTCQINTDDIKDFIPFKDITNTWATTQTEESLGEDQVKAIKDTLDRQIENLINPTEVTLQIES
tara:strand:- start:12571 stop:12915 length:345 start_codon:yes stop_codon:yes gene_type:complete